MKIFKEQASYLEALEICKKLQSKGFEAVFAGGCVRDALLDVAPKDFDIATSARPEEIEDLFERVVDVGRAFGVMLVVKPSGSFEVASFRSDGDYKDGRRPVSIVFSNLHEDALRRDFTVNAMYYDPVDRRLIDQVGGRQDLEARCLRTVGEAAQRFSEDHLRILRVIRFASQLDFNVEQETWSQACKMSSLLKSVSKERITEELSKLWVTKQRVKGFELLVESGALEALLPEVNLQWKGMRAQQQIDFKQLMSLPPQNEDLLALWSLFFSGFFSDFDFESLRLFEKTWPRLSFSKKFQRQVQLILESLQQLSVREVRTGEKLQRLGSDYGVALLKVAEYWERNSSSSRFTPSLEDLVKALTRVTSRQGELDEAFLTGEDLLHEGIKKGPQFGVLLREAFNLQLEGQLKDRQAALNWLKAQSS